MRLDHGNREVVREQVKEEKNILGFSRGRNQEHEKQVMDASKEGYFLCLGRDSGAGLMRWNHGIEAIGFTT